MIRSLAAVTCLAAALFAAPSRSDAGVIPWMYDAVFGYGHAGYGGYYGGGYASPYMTGYSPWVSPRVTARMYRRSYAFAPSYAYGYGMADSYGCSSCSTTAAYAPVYGYGWAGDCCNPCGGSCGSCGTGCGSCGTGCGSCSGPGCVGGNCGSGTSETPVSSTPAGAGQGGAQPTYAPKTEDRTPPQDQFGPARGSSSTPSTGFPDFNNTGGSTPPVDPNNSSAPGFAPAEPGGSGQPRRGGEDSRRAPRQNPLIQPGDKIAFKTPAKFTRSPIQPTFELPVVVARPNLTEPKPQDLAPTAVASK